MAHLKVICDASLNQVTKIAGYSGFVEIIDGENIVKEIFNGSRIGTLDVSMVEALAIEHGLKRLRELTQTLSLKVDNVVVYSDSATTIDQIKSFTQKKSSLPRAKKIPRVVKSIARMIKNDFQGAKYVIAKVKAHVPDKEANKIEKEHNLVDKNAVSFRKLTEKGIAQANILKGNNAVIILPDEMSYEDNEKYRAIGFHMGMEGYYLSIVGSTDNVYKNPFLLGVENFSCLFLEKVVFYEHLTTLKDVDDILSRWKRTPEFVIDLTNRDDFSKLQKHAILKVAGCDVPVLRGVDNVVEHFKINTKMKSKALLPVLKSKLNDTINGYADIITPEQLTKKIKEIANNSCMDVSADFDSYMIPIASNKNSLSRLLNLTMNVVLKSSQRNDINLQNDTISEYEPNSPVLKDSVEASRKMSLISRFKSLTIFNA